ncbi:MAG: polymer-forming cytoskeletal protein [Hyphomicrobium sp.]|nr:polymer-forming cytoskeletal protein [Hyphomicrobium sp.]
MLTIDTTTLMRGNFTAAGRIQLNTWFEGDILCSRLDVGPDGYVKGNVITRELFLEGQIVGSVNAGIVHMMEGSFVEGDVHHHIMSLHPSATLVGHAYRTTRLPFPEELLALEAKAGVAASSFPISVATDAPRSMRLKPSEWLLGA